MPGGSSWITPPYAHVDMHCRLTAGFPPIRTVGAPGVHGVGIGTQGIGVSTPSAAAVAAATVGFDSDMHITKGAMFMPVTQSAMVAAGLPPIITLADGTTLSGMGATPKLHFIMFVAVTAGAPTTGP